MKESDIKNNEDVRLLVDSFYEKVLKDEVIAYLFTEVAHLNVAEHMPVMYSFWSSILLGENSYKGNPMDKHFALNEKEVLKKEHFDRWIKLWVETVDELFTGDVAEEAKNRAKQIAQLMLFKMQQQ